MMTSFHSSKDLYIIYLLLSLGNRTNLKTVSSINDFPAEQARERGLDVARAVREEDGGAGGVRRAGRQRRDAQGGGARRPETGAPGAGEVEQPDEGVADGGTHREKTGLEKNFVKNLV